MAKFIVLHAIVVDTDRDTMADIRDRIRTARMELEALEAREWGAENHFQNPIAQVVRTAPELGTSAIQNAPSALYIERVVCKDCNCAFISDDHRFICVEK